jgi:hypothetical protein
LSPCNTPQHPSALGSSSSRRSTSTRMLCTNVGPQHAATPVAGGSSSSRRSTSTRTSTARRTPPTCCRRDRGWSNTGQTLVKHVSNTGQTDFHPLSRREAEGGVGPPMPDARC